MGTEQHEDEESLLRQIEPWLKKTGYSLDRYRKLPFPQKVLLRDLVYAKPRSPSYRQLSDLYDRLRVSENRTDSNAQAGYVPTSEELQKIFSPLSPGEALPYEDKF
ncbi:hypothetical protein ACFLWY_01570 [Chloroflexota bacterium]